MRSVRDPAPRPTPNSTAFVRKYGSDLPVIVDCVPITFTFNLGTAHLKFSPLRDIFFSYVVCTNTDRFIVATVLTTKDDL